MDKPIDKCFCSSLVLDGVSYIINNLGKVLFGGLVIYDVVKNEEYVRLILDNYKFGTISSFLPPILWEDEYVCLDCKKGIILK